MRPSHHWICCLLIVLLSACESDGGSSSDDSEDGAGDVGESPDVASRYSFETGDVSVSCDDGSMATNPPISLILEILQNDSSISLVNPIPSGSVPGVTIVSTTGASGSIDPDGSFSLTQASVATSATVSGNIELNYSITGEFTDDGWQGSYGFTASSSLFGFCRFATLFDGDRLAGRGDLQLPIDIEYADVLPVDIYDSSSVLIRLLGQY